MSGLEQVNGRARAGKPLHVVVGAVRYHAGSTCARGGRFRPTCEAFSGPTAEITVPMNSTLDGVPSIPGLVLLAESGRDATARRFRVEANRPVLLYYFDTGADPKSILKAATAYAAAERPGFAHVLRGFEHGGWAGVLIETDRGDDPFEATPIGEDAALLRIRPLVRGWLDLQAAGIEHGRLARAISIQPNGTFLALPPFCVAAAHDENTVSAATRDVLAMIDLVVHAVSGERLTAERTLPPKFGTIASPRLIATLKQLLDAAPNGGDVVALLERSYLAPRDGTPQGSRAIVAVESERSQRRLVLTALAIAAPLVVVFVMGLGGGLDRTLGFLKFRSEGEPEKLPYTSPWRDAASGTPTTDLPASRTEPVPAFDDPEELRRRGDEILAQIRKTVKPAQQTAVARDPEWVAAEKLQAEALQLIAEVHEKKVKASDRNTVLQRAIEKLESARTKLEILAEQKPALSRQLDVARQDLNQLIKSAISLKTRE
jgi:hypothetical protein